MTGRGMYEKGTTGSLLCLVVGSSLRRDSAVNWLVEYPSFRGTDDGVGVSCRFSFGVEGVAGSAIMNYSIISMSKYSILKAKQRRVGMPTLIDEYG